MSDLDRRARRLVGGWPSGGLVVGLLPDSSARNWSGKAALELAAAAADDRLAALVLDLAPDDSDLADRFDADPEPGFAQVMTGEVELSHIQYWDPVRGAYYLPGGVRVLSDKVAKSRSVEALAERVRSQEGILFVLLDRHAAEAAAETGWLDGVVRLGDADLGGPKMFGDVDALGHLDRRERVGKPWERETEEAAQPAGTGSASAPAETAAPDEPGDADLTVEPDGIGTETGQDAEPPELEVVDPSGEEEAAAAGDSPVLEVPGELWESAEARGEPGVTDEPEVAAGADELETGDEAPDAPETEEQRDSEEPELDEAAEVEAEPAPGGPDVADEPEVAEAPDEAAAPQTADGAEVETEAGEQPAEPEVAEGEEAETSEESRPPAEVETGGEPARPEISGEPELSEAPREAEVEVGAEREASDAAEAEEPDEVETPSEVETPAEPPEAEVEEPAADEVAEEVDRPAGLERFAEIAEDSDETEPARDAEEDEGDDEPEVAEAAEEATEEAPPEVPSESASEEPGDETPGEEPFEPEPEPAGEPREPVHADVITSGLEVWPEEQAVTGQEVEDPAPEAGDAQEPEPAAAGIISAAPWARPEENGDSGEPEAPAAEDFITPAMWVSGTAGEEQTAATEEDGAAVISRRQWTPDMGSAEATEVEAPEETAATGDPAESGPAEEAADSAEAGDAGDAEEAEDGAGQQRADFILDGLELPPEWSEEWEEEERAAAEAAEREAADGTDPAAEDGAEPAPGGEEAGKADFVTQGMGIPDDEEEHDDPWPDSRPTTDWSRDSGPSSGSSGTWERDPYGSSTGGAAAATAGRPDRQGLALSRRGQEDGELWRKARTAAIVVLTVGSLGVFGSAVVDSGALGAIGDVAATAVSGLGGGTSADGGGSGTGSVAAAGAGGSGSAAAAVDSARSTSTGEPVGGPDGEAPSSAGDGREEATPPIVSAPPRFTAVTDSLRNSIEDYREQMELYRQGEIGCPLLMSAREEAGRLFARLSMFRLSGAVRPDSVLRTVYRQSGEDMDWVEASYSQTGCPRPATAAPAGSVPGGAPAREPADADSAPGDSVPPQLAETPSDTAGTGGLPADSAGVRGDSLSTDTVGDGPAAGQVADTTISRPATAADSADDGQPADTASSGG